MWPSADCSRACAESTWAQNRIDVSGWVQARAAGEVGCPGRKGRTPHQEEWEEGGLKAATQRTLRVEDGPMRNSSDRPALLESASARIGEHVGRSAPSQGNALPLSFPEDRGL